MSRSKWAWTEDCAPVGVVACGVGERAGRRSLLGAVSSTKRLVRLMAASVLVIGVAPASALAGSASGSPVGTPTPNKQYSTGVDRASAVVLALGSGYSSRGGAARVRVLQRRLAGAGFAPGPIDGRYGLLTEQAVLRFQAAHGLRVDGIAGAQVLVRLGNRQPTPHLATRPSRPAGSDRPAIRSSRPAVPRKVVPAIRSTGSPSIGLLVLLIAFAVALGLSATWFARWRHNRRYADADAGANHAPRSDPADATAVHPTPTPDQTTTLASAVTPGPDPAGPDDADGAFRHALVLEEHGDEMGAIAAYQRADGLGHGAAATNLGVLLEQHGDLAAAEASYRRADQRGDANGAFNLAILLEEQGDQIGALRAYQRAEQLGHPEIADRARAATLDLRTQSESPIAAGRGGGHDGP